MDLIHHPWSPRICPRRDELIKARDKLESQARATPVGHRNGTETELGIWCFGNGNIAMETGPVEDIFPIEHGDILLPYC